MHSDVHWGGQGSHVLCAHVLFTLTTDLQPARIYFLSEITLKPCFGSTTVYKGHY